MASGSIFSIVFIWFKRNKKPQAPKTPELLKNYSMINYNHCPSWHFFSATNDSTIDIFTCWSRLRVPNAAQKTQRAAAATHSAVLRQFELLSFRYAKILGKTKMWQRCIVCGHCWKPSAANVWKLKTAGSFPMTLFITPLTAGDNSKSKVVQDRVEIKLKIKYLYGRALRANL